MKNQIEIFGTLLMIKQFRISIMPWKDNHKDPESSNQYQTRETRQKKSASIRHKEKDKPLFRPHEIPPHLQIPLKKDKNTALLEEISKR
jgi:hypothetical protein